MANRGLKRICTSCEMKFYDFGKLPIICPACGTEFTGEIEVKSRHAKSTIVPDTVKRDEIEAKNKEAAVEEDGIDDGIDDIESDDDLSDLEGDIEIAVEKDDS